MDEQIPENRTKAYWDSKVANPYHNEKMIRRERLEGYVISLVLILLCLFIFWGRGIFHFSKLVQHLCVVLAIVAGLLVFFYTEYHCRKWIYCIRMDQKTGLVESSHVTFYEVIPQSDDYSSADSDPIRKLYPEDMVVCRYHLYYKVDGKKRYHGRRYYLRCIGSKQKFDEMSAFFFEKKKKKKGGYGHY